MRTYIDAALSSGMQLAAAEGRDELVACRIQKPRKATLGFKRVASGPLVRSSYQADQQAAGKTVS